MNAVEIKAGQVSAIPNLYGLVVCGGNSSRMGIDKSKLVYHGKQQRYHLYEMLERSCEKVFISCNEKQVSGLPDDLQILVDLHSYTGIGPIAAILTAFTYYPKNNFLITGCDYPFLDETELDSFIEACKATDTPAAFYNKSENLYEPLLAYYPYGSFTKLKELYASGQYSLQSFLKMVNAEKYYAANEKSILSIDNYEDHIKAKAFLEEYALVSKI